MLYFQRMPSKIFSSAISSEPDGKKAIEEVAAKITKDLGGLSCDAAVVFISEGYDAPDSQELALMLRDKIAPKYFIGCNSSGVVGDKREVEMEPAVSVMAMHLPETKIQLFHLSSSDLDYIPTAGDLIKNIDIYPTDHPNFICLADPMTLDVTKLLRLLNEGYRGAPVIGGLSSGVVVERDNWLVLQDEIFSNGAVGIALSGDIQFQSVVSQGCRPIGEPFIITKCEQNLLLELAGKPALQILGEMYDKLPPADQKLAKHSLFVGLVMNEHRPHFRRGDFLIRNIMGVDYEKGVMIVGEELEPGQTLQFQLRDAKTAEEDLKVLLGRLDSARKSEACGGILVSCCGRGKGLFKEADHDVRMIQSAKGPFPLAGFFANGEFGPIDKKNYIHGYTSSLTILK